METILKNITEGFAAASWLDQLNLALGIVGVALMIRRSLWAFPVGLAAVTVQGGLFFQAKFHADATLQIFFFATLAWGWRHWVKDRGAAPELPVTTISWRARVAWVAGAAAATALWALTIGRWAGTPMPWRDAFIAAFSVAAQVLQARKNLENWPLWVVVNAVAVATFAQAGLAYTALLYAIYLGLAIAGWRAWAKSSAGFQPADRRDGRHSADQQKGATP